MHHWYGLNQIEDDSWLLSWMTEVNKRGIVDGILG